MNKDPFRGASTVVDVVVDVVEEIQILNFLCSFKAYDEATRNINW